MSHNTESFTLSQESQMVILKRFKYKQNYLTTTTCRGDGSSRCRTETNHMQGFLYSLSFQYYLPVVNISQLSLSKPGYHIDHYIITIILSNIQVWPYEGRDKVDLLVPPQDGQYWSIFISR